jgi:hypothetical protein
LGDAPAGVAGAALRRYARQEGAGALPLLRGLLDEPAAAPAVVLAALEALGDVPTAESAGLAARWAGEGPDAPGAEPGGAADKANRKAARRALFRLSQAGVRPDTRPAPPPPVERERPERVRRALMSAADSEGTRLLYLLIDPPLGSAQLARVIASDSLGILRFESFESSGRQFERYVASERPDRELALAEIPAPYARWLVGEAEAASRTGGRALPSSYLSFRADLAPPDTVPIPPIEDEPIALEVRHRPDLVEQSVELLDLPEFQMWLPSQEAVTPLAEEWRDVEQGPLTLPPAVLAQRRDAIRDRVVDLVTGPGGVPGARRRLEDNALVLLRRGESTAARRAMAAAARLDPDDPGAAHTHPLFQAIAERAIESILGPEGMRQTRREVPGVSDPGEQEAPPEPDEPGLRRRPSGLILPG